MRRERIFSKSEDRANQVDGILRYGGVFHEAYKGTDPEITLQPAKDGEGCVYVILACSEGRWSPVYVGKAIDGWGARPRQSMKYRGGSRVYRVPVYGCSLEEAEAYLIRLLMARHPMDLLNDRAPVPKAVSMVMQETMASLAERDWTVWMLRDNRAMREFIQEGYDAEAH